jgi:hypothetical protein
LTTIAYGTFCISSCLAIIKKKIEFSPKGHGGRNNFMIGHVKLYKDIQNIFFFDEQNGFGFLNQQLNTKAIQ